MSKEINVKPSDVAMVKLVLGGKAKVRPAMILDTRGSMIQVLLGTSKISEVGKNSVVIGSWDVIEKMGLWKPTKFTFSKDMCGWVSKSAVEQLLGEAPKDALKQFFGAWNFAKNNNLVN